eukprot:TRINITY_DN186_c0_g4_i1.p1 TRINITY_DN186_c0_g4~~TRINITY_DN186_c0_g4_i1.p1  ORF type:complete len:3955 (+),score=1074.62 TRINITY_DN186_c0_g4_i1:43-11907(+)
MLQSRLVLSAQKPGTLARKKPANARPLLTPIQPTGDKQLATSKTAPTIATLGRSHQSLESLLKKLKANPSSTEFIYCNMIPDITNPSPYDLQVVPYDKVNQGNYFTISGTSVMHFLDGDTEITTLQQWEREAFLYRKMMQINFFRKYRMWKAFMFWRKCPRLRKMAEHSKKLQKKLFVLHPTLQNWLLQVMQKCTELHKHRLYSVEKEATYTLEKFQEVQANFNLQIRELLSQVYSTISEYLETACKDEVGATVNSFAEKSANQQTAAMAGANALTASTLVDKVSSPPPASNLFTERAIVKMVCYRLARFIKLCDYLLTDALRQMMMATVVDLLTFVVPPPVTAETDEPVTQSVSKRWKGQTAPLRVHNVPFFTTEVTLENDDFLCLVPNGTHFATALKRTVNAAKDAVKSVDRLYGSQVFRVYTQAGKTEDEADDLDHGSDELERIISSDKKYAAVVENIEAGLDNAFTAAERYIAVFQPFRDLYVENVDTDLNVYNRDDVPIAKYRELLVKYQAQIKQFEEGIAAQADIGIVHCNSNALRQKMLPSPVEKFDEVTKLLPIVLSRKAQHLLDELNGANETLSASSQSVEQFVGYMKFVATTDERMPEYEDRYTNINQMNTLLEEYTVKLDETDKVKLIELKQAMTTLKALMALSDETVEKNMGIFTQQLEQNIPKLIDQVISIRGQAEHEMISDVSADQDEVISLVTDLFDRLKEKEDEAARFRRYQEMLRVPQTQFTELEDTLRDVEMKKNLWTSLKRWGEIKQEWISAQFDSVNAEEINGEVQKFARIAAQCERALEGNHVVPLLKSQVTQFKNTMTVVLDLRNEALKPRHWTQIEFTINQKIVRDETFTLGWLLDHNVMEYKEEIASISTQATQEATLEELLKKVIQSWADVDFELLTHKDTQILAGVDDVVQQLEDSLLTISTIAGSQFVAPIRQTVQDWEHKLLVAQETLDEWLGVQRAWLYLESIFSAPDIARQLPEEAKLFNEVDRSWKETMRRTSELANAIRAATHPGLLEKLKAHNAALDKIQKGLEDYLETKRVAFPRFYFLSNDELLEILAQSRNPYAVQPHLRKCFDNIVKLDMQGDQRSTSINGMISAEGEHVKFSTQLRARNNVETWLKETEDKMRETLRKLAKVAYLDYPSKPREEWIRQHCAQCVAVIDQVYWTRDVAKCLSSSNPVAELKKFNEKSRKRLDDLAELVRGELTSIERRVIVALMTIDVHARDIVDHMVEEGISGLNDFGWRKTLRYYFDEERNGGEVLIQQSNAQFIYGYEYMGPTTRLVVTPLTDRCYMTITGALHVHLGGSPAGPAGTGKTETTKDLAKGLGRQCVVFNCSDTLDYKMMGKFFSGLAQTGAWCCLDEFNRINIEVLSVVAQQVRTIQKAQAQGVTRFVFETKEIALVSTTGIFVTMNPGYAGRTELPDNLKALFRPVSMMIPDYALIAEIMLFAEGFKNAKVLSMKMVKLYKLCSEQLSQQDHYDFGMRAVKSVLVMAGALKRANPELNEDVVLIRALRDSNVPKFLKEDLSLFSAIVTDLFPGMEIPASDYGELQVTIEESMIRDKLQVVPEFVTKVIQLYETMTVRFGVMLVGPTGGGKTTIYRVLQDALTVLRRDKHIENPRYQLTSTFVLNPKCVSMGELYGEFNLTTHEWTDGLAASIVRECVADQTEDRKWVVFDGPVDALWIESMNTVLDDNKMLCLANGERIKLNDSMNMVFEVQDLAVASPATVSRCGMVYCPPSTIGWKPYVKSWLDRLPQKMTEELKTFLWGQFDKFVDDGLKFVRKNCKEDIASVDLNLVVSLCMLYQSLVVDPALTFEEDITRATDFVEKLFYFSFMWSIGGNIDASSRVEFDLHMSRSFERIRIPGGSCYDYYVDIKTRVFIPWSEIVPEFKYDPKVPYFQMLVPTVDTVRNSFLMEKLIGIDRSVLFTGVTGVGKSVIAVDLISRLAAAAVAPVFINFSAQTSSIRTQEMIEGKLEKKRKNILGAPVGKKIVLFVDDVNMPAREEYGAQPPIELLRQYQDFRGFYDRQKLFWKEIKDVVIVAACAPPGGGRNEVTPRFFRHFNMLNIPPPSDDSMRKIFGSILGGFFANFQPEVRATTKSIVDSSVEVYTRICKELLPTPAKSHYTFNLRDLSKVIQGVLQAKMSTVSDKESAARLWTHESMRVFYDRLINREDRRYFVDLLIELAKRNFGLTWSADSFEERPIIYGDFMRIGVSPEQRQYEFISDMPKLVKVLTEYQADYNDRLSKEVNLVFFMDAMEHIARIARIIRQPRGNAMLVGVGGTGKQSLTRLACFMGEYQCFQIELKKGYNNEAFREDMRKLYKIAGSQNKPVVFLFTDTQIINEGFLEDINNILNSGEIPNLFPADELEAVITEVRPAVRAAGLPETRESIYAYFINRVRDNLHIVLCMSPVGDQFRVRCRQFPSLINCCTIDWFDEWPEKALLSVSKRFLESANLDGMQDKIAALCVEIHQSVSKMCGIFYQELRRRFYTTPTSYLELINLYLSMLQEKRTDLTDKRDRYRNGLSKLYDTQSRVNDMQAELESMQPVLASKAKETDELIKQIAIETKSADEVKAVVASEEVVVRAQKEETQALAANAKADLDEAMPALHAAVESLSALNKNDITEIRSFTKPPPLVQTVMEAVCILLGQKPDWASAKAVLGTSDFMSRLVNYDKDNVPAPTLKKLKKYLDMEDFVPSVVEKVSKAAKSLCMWVRAMDVYSNVAKTVAPKRAKLKEMEDLLASAEQKLKGKVDELRAVEEKLEKLRRECDIMVAEKNRLAESIDQTAKRLDRAGRLITGLGGERTRWEEAAVDLDVRIGSLVGNVFLAAACVAYFGAFTGAFRQRLIDQWVTRCLELGIPVATDFSLRDTMSDPVQVREWLLAGLPTDNVSIDSGVLVTRGRRWPLMIDPQGQANKWIKNMEQRSSLKIIKTNDGSNFMRTLENAIRMGNPVLLEDCGEQLEPSLEPVLLKQTYRQGQRLLIMLGGSDVDYNPNFRFYMTTKMANPHYLPEVCVKVTIINFTVTPKGLEDQLLGDVVRKEKPQLEENKNQLVVSMAADKKALKDLEDKILRLLQSSEGNILDDEGLIATLNDSKTTSALIGERVKQAEETEIDINAAREQYRPMSARGSLLFFVIADMALVDPMYQYSLTYFKKLFNYCIDASARSDDVQERVDILINTLTETTYVQVCRGLFEAHKAIFSFMICVSILRQQQEVSDAEWNALLRGFGMVTRDKQPDKPDHAWLSAPVWENVFAMQTNLNQFFAGMCDSVINDVSSWQQWFESALPHKEPLPAPWDERLTSFQRLLILKTFRPEKLVFAFTDFVSEKLGRKFITNPPISLETVFNDTGPATPIIFVLSVGADPTSFLLQFAEERGYANRLQMISLGQGQGPIAQAMVQKAAGNGDWVLLQNCHLAASWMPKLEKIVEDFSAAGAKLHPDFRLWLTSMPSEQFPVLVLQNGVKLTNEPPKGLRANLTRSFASLNESLFEGHSKEQSWKKLLFGLAFFHAVLQERRKFGPLGWNIQYEFNDSDFSVSLKVLKMFLEEQAEIPWDALKYVTGEINYGGRVTDDWDRRCLNSILGQFYNTSMLNDDYRFSPSGRYYAPPIGSLADCRDYVDQLPMTDDPEIFGMHENANIVFQQQETRKILETIINIQPRESGGIAGKSPDEVANELAERILADIPKSLSMEEGDDALFAVNEHGLMNSLAVVLMQEMDRFNRLLARMRRSLVDIGKAIKGLVVMSGELDRMFTSLLNNEVPKLWASVAYPSLKPLASWVRDLFERVAFMRSWLQKGEPVCFWLSGFFFPQGFMTGALQNYARKTQIPIDQLNFGFQVVDQEHTEITKRPDDGMYIHGLFLDGARWDKHAHSLADSPAGEMYSTMPVVHFIPKRHYTAPPRTYAAPVYKTSVRAGVLSTTGQSTNFVIAVQLPTEKPSDYWVLKGTALLCQLND